MGVVSW